MQQPRVIQEPAEPTARHGGGEEAGAEDARDTPGSHSLTNPPARLLGLYHRGAAQRDQ